VCVAVCVAVCVCVCVVARLFYLHVSVLHRDTRVEFAVG